MTLTIGGREIPATHRPLLRMLLTLSDTPMDDMMTSLTMAANLIPTAVVLTGAGDVRVGTAMCTARRTWPRWRRRRKIVC